MLITASLLFFAVLSLLGMVVPVFMVGRERKPLTPVAAGTNILLNLWSFLLMLALLWGLR